jgi:hypothetical protein
LGSQSDAQYRYCPLSPSIAPTSTNICLVSNVLTPSLFSIADNKLYEQDQMVQLNRLNSAWSATGIGTTIGLYEVNQAIFKEVFFQALSTHAEEYGAAQNAPRNQGTAQQDPTFVLSIANHCTLIQGKEIRSYRMMEAT